ncbi:MAG: hypothetical protein ONB48_10685 [candidate division KSB1 bacterium]|nr:hypothetical protein [candidate division KSB1 bacterium]MDZ7273954.1 hypothetical protein [candidate division KSB1 bacterium]MDZ7286110.1 hypothetical protein [candidate division KSB1 bacterium]MDZ7299142.1 hypothetical protein [candidate division KSB1 bacterium]MDZ7308339.1 hypothetical protein [candidate division KSB1 bacterium]
MAMRVLAFVFGISLSMLFLACAGDETTKPGEQDIEKTAATLDLTATATADYFDMSALSLAVGQLLPGLGKAATPPETLRVSTCPLIIFDRSAKQVTLDFDGGCQAADGVTRSGTINLSYSGSLRSSATLTLTFNNFSAHGYTYSGQVVISVNNGAVTVALENAAITDARGQTTRLAGTFAVKAAIGKPLDFSDDVYLAGGSLIVTDKDGKRYNFTITEDLEITLTCAHPRKGKMEGTSSDGVAVKVDFFPADGGCDDLAVITIGGVTREIHLGE